MVAPQADEVKEPVKYDTTQFAQTIIAPVEELDEQMGDRGSVEAAVAVSDVDAKAETATLPSKEDSDLDQAEKSLETRIGSVDATGLSGPATPQQPPTEQPVPKRLEETVDYETPKGPHDPLGESIENLHAGSPIDLEETIDQPTEGVEDEFESEQSVFDQTIITGSMAAKASKPKQKRAHVDDTQPDGFVAPKDIPSDGNRLKSDSASQKSFGRYDIKKRLGKGPFGAVYLSFDPQLERQVAIKAPHLHLDSKSVEREFLFEARQLAKLNHPGIVSVYDVGVDDGQCYIVSDYLEGLNLEDWLKVNKPTWQQAV
ncbi:MAG: hypothetical protein CMJ78_06860 [Planctomycetaceae bacterium]|nr:hypothetical protein [Planctomycetaceae bacterium]